MKALLVSIVIIVGIIIVIGIATFAVSAMSSQKLTRQNVQQIAQNAGSLVAETTLLDQQIQYQKVTTNYAQVYLKDLQQQVSDTEQQVDKPASRDVQTEVKEQKQIIKQVKQLLSQSLSDVDSPMEMAKNISALEKLEQKQNNLLQSL